MDIKNLIQTLRHKQQLPPAQMQLLLTAAFSDDDARTELARQAQQTAQAVCGNKIYIRGLIEFTNYCRNDCYYCGIRRSNAAASRYRLSKKQILSCCEQGYALGFRTFVLQGGEDLTYSDADMAAIITAIRQAYPDCAITLSVGERSRTTYQLWKEAGADRYLLRHETANDEHYARLHPAELKLSNRKRCLYDLKELGYQVGTGFMVGSPWQTLDNLLNDLAFISELQPQMIGIGPFIPHHATPFNNYPAGTLAQTLTMLSVLRLMFPKVLLPATTALGTIAFNGRELGILAGANVVMPNLSPADVRQNYLLYDNKLCSGAEAAEAKNDLAARLHAIGYEIAEGRGDYKES
nr:[FeFe] hydrogenase H-cluster radical SAM maturase HydE [uncultured Phascolarctobacterium sp.]